MMKKCGKAHLQYFVEFLIILSVSCGNSALGQSRRRNDRNISRTNSQSNRSAESKQLQHELKSLRQSYRQRLQQLDKELNRLGLETDSAQSVEKNVKQASDQFVIDESSSDSVTETLENADANSTWLESFRDKLQVTLGTAGTLKIYGHARGDLIFANSRLNNTIVPFFAVSEDPAFTEGPSAVAVKNNDGGFDMNVRLTRLGLDYSNTQSCWLNCAELSAKIEGDFETLLNITPESRPVPRIRHAYAQMRWGDFSVLMGVTWDVISPLYPTINGDTLMWNAGNLGDRRPMLRLKWDTDDGDGSRFVVAGAISAAGAIDRKDIDGNGTKDGEDSGIPAVQGRIGYETPSWIANRTIGLGVWGFVSFESINVPIAGHDDFTGRGVGFDFSVPLMTKLTLRGEAWYGRNLSDWRGGSGQGINTTNGREIESAGGWVELLFQPNKIHQLSLGITADDPTDGDLTGMAAARTLNWTWYVGNGFNLGGGLSIHLNAEFWNTEYLTFKKGDAFRFKTVFIQRF